MGAEGADQLADLNREDQKYNPRESSLTEMQYAAYRNGIWQSNTLGQMFAAQTAHSAMVAQQLYMENARLDLTDYKRAKAIHDQSGNNGIRRGSDEKQRFRIRQLH